MQNQFYQTTNPNIPVQLAQNATNIMGIDASFLKDVYASQVGAISRSYTSPSQAFGNVASGLGNLFSFSKAF
jgi:hypothetical protein